MRVSRAYLSEFAGIYGGGGNRTRVPVTQETSSFQQKRREAGAAYRASSSFVRSFEIDVYRYQDRLGRGTETNLYFVCELEADGAFKVGLGLDPLERLRTLQIGSARELVLYAAVPATGALEPYIHQVLRRDRIRGEWFHPSRRTLALADMFRGIAQMLWDMEQNECGPVDSGDTLTHLTWVVADAIHQRAAA